MHKRIILKNGTKAVVREIETGDEPELLEFTNSLIKERVDIARVTPLSLFEEEEWVAECLKKMHEKNMVYVVAEVEGEIMGGASITRNQMEVKKHVGTLSISIHKKFRYNGLARKLMKIVFAQAKKIGIRIVVLDVYETNKRAQKIYKKAGFKKAGTIPGCVFKKRKYVDNIVMWKKI